MGNMRIGRGLILYQIGHAVRFDGALGFNINVRFGVGNGVAVRAASALCFVRDEYPGLAKLAQRSVNAAHWHLGSSCYRGSAHGVGAQGVSASVAKDHKKDL
ncbi:MAG: hypothetical protein AAF823_11490 [Planctomycetota bacterium]